MSTSSMAPESGPEQFRIHSSIVSKLLALPENGIKKVEELSKVIDFGSTFENQFSAKVPQTAKNP